MNSRANPYVGPRSLRYGEHIYGRDREARQLLELLIAERIVLLYSPSGAGKTSLIQAGLIPELEKEEFHVLPVIRVNRDPGPDVAPKNLYVMSTLLSLEREVPPERALPVEELAAMSLADYLKRREATSGTDDGTFLVFDQFEEILTIDPMNRDAKIEFFNQVGEVLRDLTRWALFSMREDHVAALDPYLRPIPTRLKSTFRLDLLTAESARIAVQLPAKVAGVEVTEEATTKLVDDLRQVAVQGPTGATEHQLGPYVEPVQLQVVCYRLWEKLPGNAMQITAVQVEGTGDVDSALADYYSERVAQIAVKTAVKERVLREWFDRRLITESGIRGQVMVGSESTKDLNDAAIQALVDVHLIRGEERRGVTWLELAHDRLVKPIRANNSVWWERNLSVLQHQAAVWNNQGRSDALCLRGEARKDAKAWAEEHAAELTETEREFIGVCERNHDARTNRWAWWAALGLSVVLGCISVLAVYAWRQAEEAKRESRIATARSIASRALQLRDDRLDVSLLLATEAQRRSDLPDTRGSLLTTAYANPRLSSYLNGSLSPIYAVAFSHDGAKVATGDFDGLVTIWDAKTRRVIESLPKFVQDAVRTIAFSPDGHYMAVSSKEPMLVLRDLRTGELKRLPAEQAHKGDVWCVTFSRDSSLVASCDIRGEIRIWNHATGDVQKLSTEIDTRAVSFDPTGTLLAAGCSNGAILLWQWRVNQWVPVKREFSPKHPGDPEPDLMRRAENVKLDERRKNVRCLAISPDGKYLAAGRRSGALDLYDLAAPGDVLNVAAFRRHDGAVSALAFSADATRLISSGFDGTLRLSKVPSLETVGPPFTGHVGRVLGVAFSSDKQAVVSGGTDRRAILWDTWMHVAQTGRAESVDAPFGVAFSPDGVFEANGYADGTVMLVKRDLANWPAFSARTLMLATEPGGRVPIVVFSGDSQRLAASDKTGKVRVFDLAKGGKDGAPPILGEIDATGGNAGKRITAMALSRDGATLAVSLTAENLPAQIFAWKVAAREPLFSEPLFDAREDENFAVEFSPDGSRLVAGGRGERAVMWEIGGKGKPAPQIFPEEHTGTIRCVAFSPDGKIFVTASGDNTLILWDAQTRRRLAPPFTGHQAPVVVAAFSPDGRLLATGSDDHSVILWDVPTKQPTGRLTGHTDSVRALAFSSDSKQLFTGSWGEEARKWELDPKALQNICRDRANRNLTESEWSVYMDGSAYKPTWPSLPVSADIVGEK